MNNASVKQYIFFIIENIGSLSTPIGNSRASRNTDLKHAARDLDCRVRIYPRYSEQRCFSGEYSHVKSEDPKFLACMNSLVLWELSMYSLDVTSLGIWIEIGVTSWNQGNMLPSWCSGFEDLIVTPKYNVLSERFNYIAVDAIKVRFKDST